ncbi:MAG: hypothetical protein ACAH80_09245 [Alphaproteobacteria bacterium]
MATPVTPDADKGREAVRKIAKLAFFGVSGVLMAGLGVVGVVFGLISVLSGYGTTALCIAGGFFTMGGGAAAGSFFAGKHVLKRNAPHLEALAKEEQREKLEKERRAAEAAEAAEAARQTKQRRPAKKAFNPEAAVKLDNDVKTMRPLKFNTRAPQQPQAQP